MAAQGNTGSGPSTLLLAGIFAVVGVLIALLLAFTGVFNGGTASATASPGASGAPSTAPSLVAGASPSAAPSIDVIPTNVSPGPQSGRPIENEVMLGGRAVPVLVIEAAGPVPPVVVSV